jgi:hypothetical protein
MKLALAILITPFCFGACHALGPSATGSGSGADWNDIAALTATPTLTRGDTYYLESGTYSVGSSGLNWSTANSGTTLITVLGATSADHGQTCSLSAGWNGSTMDVTNSPAHFVTSVTWVNSDTSGGLSIWSVTTSNWVFNGNTCAANQITTTGQGILIDNSSTGTNSSFQFPFIADNGSTTLGNVTLKCVEIMGEGMSSYTGDDHVTPTNFSCNSAGTVATITLSGTSRWFPAGTAADGTPMPASQIAVTSVSSGNFNKAHALVTGLPASNKITYAVSCTSNASVSGSGTVDGAYDGSNWSPAVQFSQPAGPVEGDFTFQYLSIHDSFGPYQFYGGTPMTIIDHSYMARAHGNSTEHTEMFTYEGSSGTYYASFAISNNIWRDGENTGNVVVLYGGLVNGFYMYGNTVDISPGNPYNVDGYGNSALFDCINSGVVCENVFIYNNTLANIVVDSSAITCVLDSATATNWTIENNIVFNSTSPSPVGCGGSVGGTYVHDYNTYINNASASDGGAHSYIYTGAANPFVATFNYKLSSETVDAHLNDGTTISNANGQTYNTDPLGLIRGADGTWERGAYEFNLGGPPTGSVGAGNSVSSGASVRP